MAGENGEVTIVGAGARLEGNVVSAGNLRIDGQVKGQINAEGDVALSPQSQVEADIRAQNVSIAGRFKGSIQVKGKAHLARGGGSTATSRPRPSWSRRAASSTARASWTARRPRKQPVRREARRRRPREREEKRDEPEVKVP